MPGTAQRAVQATQVQTRLAQSVAISAGGSGCNGVAGMDVLQCRHHSPRVCSGAEVWDKAQNGARVCSEQARAAGITEGGAQEVTQVSACGRSHVPVPRHIWPHYPSVRVGGLDECG